MTSEISSPRPPRCTFLALSTISLLGACAGDQSALDPKSTDAALIADIWWWMLAVGVAVFLAVMTLLALGVARGWREERESGLGETRRWALVVSGGVVLPLIAIVVLVVSSLAVGRDIAGNGGKADVDIEIVGKQWWWEVHYLDESGQRVATTANEIHIPVGRNVRFLLKSDNVIHSFWVPNLQGKTDLVPGRVNETRLRASRPGTYRGQCAEFCGTQHAFMAFVVVAEPPDRFAAWLDRQSGPTVIADDETADAGRQAFNRLGCGACHTIRGTSAAGTLGPDLTHLASRKTLAAGTLPNTREHLAAWISDPQDVKPGNAMPAVPVPEQQRGVLLDYLERLE